MMPSSSWNSCRNERQEFGNLEFWNLPYPPARDKVKNMKITPQQTRITVGYPVRALAVAAAAAAFTSCDQQVVGTEPATPEKPDSTRQNIRGKYLVEQPTPPTTPAQPNPSTAAPDPQPQKIPGEPPETPQKPDDRTDQMPVGLYPKETPANKETQPAPDPDPKDIPQALPGDVPAPVKE